MSIWIGTKDGLRTLESPRLTIEGPIGALAHDAGLEADGAVWAVVNGRELWRNGERVAMSPLDVTALHVRNGTVLVGTATARLLVLEGDALSFVEGFDALERRAWGTPWGGPPDIFTLAILEDGAWLAGVHVGGVWRSADRGRTWTEVVAIGADDHDVRALGNDVVVACGGGPIAISRDAGRTFAFAREGVPHSYGTAVALAHTKDESVIVLACSTGPYGKQGVLVRRALDAEAFAPSLTATANVHALSARGPLVACASDDGRVYLSKDAGATWTDEGDVGAHAVLVV